VSGFRVACSIVLWPLDMRASTPKEGRGESRHIFFFSLSFLLTTTDCSVFESDWANWEISCLSAHAEWAALSAFAEIIEPEARSREEFIAECKSGRLDRVKVAYRTFQSVVITGLVDEELVQHLPAGLGFIAHNGMF
jgi:hypothetical protein